MPNIALAVGLGKASPLKRPLGCDTKSHIWLIGKAPRCLSNPHLTMVDPGPCNGQGQGKSPGKPVPLIIYKN